ncbi:hypothetical protein LguiA_021973 [Lonicera macranthoides]
MLRPCSVKTLNRTSRENEDSSSVVGDENNIEERVHLSTGIPVVPSNSSKGPGVIFVFEKASLVPALVGKTHQILNAEDHVNFLRRKKLDPYSYRPDIIFEALLELTDSNLYREGRIQAIYVRTDQGVLIKIEPNIRLPRTFGSFCSMMLQTLQKLSINAQGKRGKLLRLVKNPVTQHLPVNSLKIGLSFSSEKLVHMKDYVGAISNDVNLVFVVGAMAHGKIDCEYVDDFISVSEYPLSAVCCIRRIYRALEKKLNII